MYRKRPATTRTAAMSPMLYEPFDVHAVHLRGNLRKSKAYPWGTFCRKTKFEDGSPNLTTDPGRVTCLACLKRLREKADASQPNRSRELPASCGVHKNGYLPIGRGFVPGTLKLDED